MRKSQRLSCRKSTSWRTMTRKCCPAIAGTLPSETPAPCGPWQAAQVAISASPCTRSGWLRSTCSYSCCGMEEACAVKGSSALSNHPDTRRLSHRSEEHTSELQSLRHLVCRLLLEK